MSVYIAIVLTLHGVLGGVGFYLLRKRLNEIDAAAQADTSALLQVNIEMTVTIEAQRLDVRALTAAVEAMRLQLVAVHDEVVGPSNTRPPLVAAAAPVSAVAPARVPSPRSAPPLPPATAAPSAPR